MTDRTKFFELLSAAFNISPEAEPGSDRGRNRTNAALAFARDVYDKLDRARPGEAAGILLVLRLFGELEENSRPSHVDEQIAKGWAGTRHGWTGR